MCERMNRFGSQKSAAMLCIWNRFYYTERFTLFFYYQKRRTKQCAHWPIVFVYMYFYGVHVRVCVGVSKQISNRNIKPLWWIKRNIQQCNKSSLLRIKIRVIVPFELCVFGFVQKYSRLRQHILLICTEQMPKEKTENVVCAI